MQVVATSTTSGNSCERINFQLNFRDCHAKIRQVDSHETLANGVVVQVLSLDLHITFLTSFQLFSYMSHTRWAASSRTTGSRWGGSCRPLFSLHRAPRSTMSTMTSSATRTRWEFRSFFLNLLELHFEGFWRTYIVHYSSIFIHIYLLSSAQRFSMRAKKVLEPLRCLWTLPKLSPRRSRFFIFTWGSVYNILLHLSYFFFWEGAADGSTSWGCKAGGSRAKDPDGAGRQPGGPTPERVE